MIGAVPPAAIAHWRYFAVTIAAGLVGFFCLRTNRPVEDAGAALRRRRPLPARGNRHREGAGLRAHPVRGAGAGSIAPGFTPGLPSIPVMVFGAGLSLFLRLMSLYRGWRLPSSKSHKETD
ncbi:MAG: hypothetical protein GEV13_14675 [Rhodospirillales bacterium]|nr:hypothetical protein [Rhodospirillales bacterium]